MSETLCTFDIVQQLVKEVLLHMRAEERRVQRDDALFIFDKEHVERRQMPEVMSVVIFPPRRRRNVRQRWPLSRD